MASWPAALPVLRLPVSYGLRDNTVFTPMEIGPPETRRRSTVRFKPFSCVLRFTAAQLATFETFYEDTIGDGTLPFEIALPPPVNATVNLLMQPPAPVFQKAGLHYVANVQFWIVP